MNIKGLKKYEKAVFALRSLYKEYGYLRYKMSKFEEYDLYAGNKDFLVSDNVITFTDTNGKLMALKPDVTLSIIKNGKDDNKNLEKVFYDENVYRVSKGTRSFKEFTQIGLECIGKIDDYSVFEVLMLAARSLETISADYVLDISHLGIISDIVSSLNVPSAAEKRLIHFIGEKNAHEITSLLEENDVPDNKIKLLKSLITTYGTPEKVLPKLTALMPSGKLSKSAIQLEYIVNALKACGYGKKIRIDFSVVNDMSYYNGIVFKGFINGVSEGVLSGGQYDNLMKKMGRKSAAIGFAVYLDNLERLGEDENEFDVDSVVLYNSDKDISALYSAVSQLIKQGDSVNVTKNIPSKIKYRKLYKFDGKEVELIETNA